MLDTISEFAKLIGIIGTFIGVWIAVRSLRENHEWNRRQYAMNIIVNWNQNTVEHAKAIEEQFPGIRYLDRMSGAMNEITLSRAIQILGAKPESEDFNVRFHIISLLNYFEYVALSASTQVADRDIIINTLSGPIRKWISVLHNFNNAVSQCWGFQPWDGLLKTVEQWGDPEKIAPKTGTIFKTIHQKP